jgi:hypothetical protein
LGSIELRSLKTRFRFGALSQLAAIICGWCAAEEYDLHPKQQQGEWQYIFGLLGTRYTSAEIGMMMGYTFSFISGFLKNERTDNIKKHGVDLPVGDYLAKRVSLQYMTILVLI